MGFSTGLFVAVLGIAGTVRGLAASGTAFGMATGTTGGGDAAAVTPTSLAQVVSVLSDTTTRVVNIDRIWDFTTYYGTKTMQYCKPWTCTPNPQYLLNSVGGCSGILYNATVYLSGSATNLEVNSNKTVRGIGSNAGFKGIGIRINGKTNVIIQNLRITDLNQQYVWGGDGISVLDSTNVWVDHNYVARVGRQLVTVAYTSNKVSVTNNYFDGVATYTPYCNGYHYWGFINGGPNLAITYAQNYIYHIGGRGPDVAGGSTDNTLFHAYNNYFNDIVGTAFQIGVGAHVLMEGNQFTKVQNAVSQPTGPDGTVYYVDQVAQAGTPCTSTIGRICEWNKYNNSGSLPLTRQDTSVLSSMAAWANVKSKQPYSVWDVPTNVLANAGTGHV